MTKLLEARSYGKHQLEYGWRQTINKFKKGLMANIRRDKVPFFLARGDHYATFIIDGIALMIAHLANPASRCMNQFCYFWVSSTAKFLVHEPPPPRETSTQPARSSKDTNVSAEADDTWTDVGARTLRPPTMMYPEVPLMQWCTKK